jgi:hypothetical protein
MDVPEAKTIEDSPIGEWLASLAIVASWGTLVVVLLHG